MNQRLPSGTVTFLFTDIEGSTAKWEADPEAMAMALRFHDEICRQTVRAAGGRLFKMTGDGSCSVFADAGSGVGAALALRQGLDAQDWPAGIGPLRARMALHTGPAEEREGDYFGPTLNRVARLMGAAHGGQIVVSEATKRLLDGGSVSVHDLGEHRLRDLLESEHIYQVGDEEHPPLRTFDAHQHNLPTQVTAFVGRERELHDLLGLVPATPLVTLTGPGGTGKSRLALQAAAELVGHFEGVYFVALASVRNPDNVGPAIAEAVGIQLHDDDPDGILAAHLAARRYLLVLDNFEQLMPAADLLGAVLDAAPDLRILVTSRELLRLRAEHNYPLSPLDTPPEGADLPAPQLTRYDALRLFEVRARAVRPDFRLDDTNADDVAAICRLVDGLPLAIELAAARIRLFSPSQLRSALASDLKALGRGPRDAPRRQQTLIETIGWSYELLDAAEQVVFRRLAVFVGGCPLDAVEAVALHDRETEPIGMLEALADKSLIRVESGQGNQPRMQMLETIRSFARSELQSSGESTDLLHRHAAYFAELGEEAAPEMRGRKQEEWMRRLDEERANMRAALAWSFDGGATVVGLRMVAALRDYWFYQGQLREMGRWAGEALARVGEAEPWLEAGVLLTAGFHAYSVYRDDAPELIGRAAGLYADTGDEYHLALALIFEAGARENVTGDLDSSRRGLEEGIGLARRIGADQLVASGLTLWGELERKHGRFERARQIQEESLELARQTGEERRVAMVLNNLGLIAHHLGDDEAAERLIRESLIRSVEIRFDANTAHCLIALAEQVTLRGEPARGARLMGAADAHFEKLGLIAQPGDAPDFSRIRSQIRAALDDQTFEVEMSEGRKLTLDQAVDLALCG